VAGGTTIWSQLYVSPMYLTSHLPAAALYLSVSSTACSVPAVTPRSVLQTIRVSQRIGSAASPLHTAQNRFRYACPVARLVTGFPSMLSLSTAAAALQASRIRVFVHVAGHLFTTYVPPPLSSVSTQPYRAAELCCSTGSKCVESVQQSPYSPQRSSHRQFRRNPPIPS